MKHDEQDSLLHRTMTKEESLQAREALANSAKDRLRKLLLQHVDYGEFTLSSGAKSNVYLDCRPVLLSPEGAELAGRIVLDSIRRLGVRVDGIAGVPYGGISMAVSASVLSSLGSKEPLYTLIPRMERKSHGAKNAVEGPCKEGDQVCVVDDVLTTGGSLIKVIETLRAAGMQARGVVCLVNRGGHKAKERVRTEGRVEVLSVFELDERRAGTGLTCLLTT